MKVLCTYKKDTIEVMDSSPKKSLADKLKSLGVKIGDVSVSESTSNAEGESKCPFAAMVKGVDGASGEADPESIPWTTDALARLENVPEFVRPMAKMGIERLARDRQYPEINEEVLDLFPGLKDYIEVLNKAAVLNDVELIRYVCGKLSDIFKLHFFEQATAVD